MTPISTAASPRINTASPAWAARRRIFHPRRRLPHRLRVSRIRQASTPRKQRLAEKLTPGRVRSNMVSRASTPAAAAVSFSEAFQILK